MKYALIGIFILSLSFQAVAGNCSDMQDRVDKDLFVQRVERLKNEFMEDMERYKNYLNQVCLYFDTYGEFAAFEFGDLIPREKRNFVQYILSRTSCVQLEQYRHDISYANTYYRNEMQKFQKFGTGVEGVTPYDRQLTRIAVDCHHDYRRLADRANTLRDEGIYDELNSYYRKVDQIGDNCLLQVRRAVENKCETNN